MSNATKQSKSVTEWTPTKADVDSLLLDPKNPRLQDVGLDENASQTEIAKALWRGMAVDEVALSIANNGFYPHEPMFVAKENGKSYVVEGNRRLVAVKLLRSASLRKEVGATGLPDLSKEAIKKLDQVPIIECTRGEIWAFLGFKHINGPQAWDSYPKAHYIAWVRNSLNVDLVDIATRIGDKHSTVARHYDALMVLEQAERAGVFDRNDRYKQHFSFSHLFTGLGYTGIKKFLGLPVGEKALGKQNPVPKKHEQQLGDLMRWMYGSKRDDIKPVVQSQNPDLRQLDEVLQSSSGTIALRKGLPLRVSLEVSKGDERVFREALIEAKQSLQRARGTALTGYHGNRDLLAIARDISTLSSSLLAEMQTVEAAADPPQRGRSRS